MPKFDSVTIIIAVNRQARTVNPSWDDDDDTQQKF